VTLRGESSTEERVPLGSLQFLVEDLVPEPLDGRREGLRRDAASADPPVAEED
jgi:hypothetical protein